jgi:hypothetical protein
VSTSDVRSDFRQGMHRLATRNSEFARECISATSRCERASA